MNFAKRAYCGGFSVCCHCLPTERKGLTSSGVGTVPGRQPFRAFEHKVMSPPLATYTPTVVLDDCINSCLEFSSQWFLGSLFLHSQWRNHHSTWSLVTAPGWGHQVISIFLMRVLCGPHALRHCWYLAEVSSQESSSFPRSPSWLWSSCCRSQRPLL